MVPDLLRWGKAQLADENISAVDAELLLAHVLNISRMQLHSESINLTADEITRVNAEFHEVIAQRQTGRPTQYITGQAPFRYLILDVGEGVLIPRPETEVLVDEVLHQLQRFGENGEPVSIVDLGAGSGAIAISIVSEVLGKKDVRVVAVEKSPEAVKWLRQNIAKYDLPIRVIVEDVSAALIGVKCDIVVANPPYIPATELLPSEVSGFEPDIALQGGDRLGITVPKVFIQAANRILKVGGLLALEHHENQASLIAEILSAEFHDIRTHYDLTERARFTTAVKN
jgi:release factor glutamine methyltransferase